MITETIEPLSEELINSAIQQNAVISVRSLACPTLEVLADLKGIKNSLHMGESTLNGADVKVMRLNGNIIGVKI